MSTAVIYRPKGKAGEYADWACNLYDGCTHKCTYCYVPGIRRMSRELFHSNVTSRKDILSRLRKDVAKLGPGMNVFLCFTCDPYPEIERTLEITRKAMEILHDGGCNFTVLTKCPTLAYRDIDLYGVGDWFGTTLTFTPEGRYGSNAYEPYAEMPHQRYMGLQAFADMGVKTWVSLEPVIDPQESLQIIADTYSFVDSYKIGKLNYTQTNVDWRAFAQEAVELCQELGAKYILKESLKELLND